MDKSARLEDIVRKHKTKIKVEKFDEDIKEFAETAMNELLGWYGYGASKEETRTGTYNSHSNSNSSGPDSPRNAEGCGWCGKAVDENTGISSASATFCSELCFSHSRRANFKKNKTCDWCRHVRHTVSYVDFQDGASQLQFCSDKCLNQYKMHIFCRETRAHLEMHPHLVGEDTETGLITPDLWMKNCKSPNSRSSSPPLVQKHLEVEAQTSPLPLITLAHPSKLLAPISENVDTAKRQRKIQRKIRKRCPSTITTCTDLRKSSPEGPQDLRIRHTSPNNFESTQVNAEAPKEFSTKSHNERTEKPLFSSLPNSLHTGPRLLPPQFLNPPQVPQTSLQSQPGNLLPPVTVLVPYPILLPVPIPIPIPLPITSFLKAYQTTDKPKEDAPSSSQEALLDCSVQTTESSQNLENHKEEFNNNQTEEEKETTSVCITKPIRKRKKITEVKAKINVKSKKTLSV